MSNLLLAVMSQARHVHAVHSFICELLTITMPDLVKGSEYIRNGTEFCESIDRAIMEVTTPTATESDYVRAIVEAACREMEMLCRLLKSAGALAGLDRIAAEYLDGQRFREMLLRKDSAKLERLIAIVRAREGKPIKILMDVAAALDGREGNYDGMNASAKRKAAVDMKKVIAKVDEIRSSMAAHRDEIVEHVDAVGGKVDEVGRKIDGMRLKGKRRSKYSEAAREACLAYWDAAQTSAEVKHAINTRITYESVFRYYARQLGKHGISTLKKFRTILHAAQSLESSRRVKALEAKIEAEGKKPSQKSAKQGTLHNQFFRH